MAAYTRDSEAGRILDKTVNLGCQKRVSFDSFENKADYALGTHLILSVLIDSQKVSPFGEFSILLINY